jgi:hypothetical protein
MLYDEDGDFIMVITYSERYLPDRLFKAILKRGREGFTQHCRTFITSHRGITV